MKKTEQKVLSFIKEKNLIEKDDKILVALSGGPDSVFLLHFLYKFKNKLKITIGAIHINHMIRGKAAGEDEEFCRNLSLYLGIQFYKIRKNVKGFATKNKISVEEAGRKIRYNEFERISRKFEYNKIATAHNCGDNAETVLLNLIKGTGLKGISGIPVVRGKIIRPILNLTKDEIINYLDEENIKYQTDLSNLSNDYERNFLRNSVIPLIKARLNPDFENSVFNSSEIFKETNEYFEKEVEKLKIPNRKKKGSKLKIPLHLIQTDKAISGYLLKNAVERNFLVQVSFNDIKKITSILNKEPGSKAELSNKLFVFREREEIIISKAENDSVVETRYLNAGDKVKINGKTIAIKMLANIPGKYSNSKKREFISAKRIKGNFMLRRWKAGERFIPIGLKGSKKISDFLNEQKTPSSKKKEQLVLINNNKIVWVVGLRLDDRFKITNQTEKAYELWVK